MITSPTSKNSHMKSKFSTLVRLDEDQTCDLVLYIERLSLALFFQLLGPVAILRSGVTLTKT